MINNAAFPPVGILGLGFLGQILAREFSAVPESWGTWHLTPPPEPILSNFSFDWANENNWSALPETPVTLVMTIPPLLKNPETETERLHLWGKWMSHNRPELKRMIYISSTGVYPKLNGIWSEDSEFEADTNSGKLRLLTEKILSKYFTLKIIPVFNQPLRNFPGRFCLKVDCVNAVGGVRIIYKMTYYSCKVPDMDAVYRSIGNWNRLSRLEAEINSASVAIDSSRTNDM